ncbi:MAG: hypothetical protein KDD35_11710, partial [Bdellovibrionales bacterium]|nr:hypothetical protein [Bdellovibrionales bacterium]
KEAAQAVQILYEVIEEDTRRRRQKLSTFLGRGDSAHMAQVEREKSDPFEVLMAERKLVLDQVSFHIMAKNPTTWRQLMKAYDFAKRLEGVGIRLDNILEFSDNIDPAALPQLKKLLRKARR